MGVPTATISRTLPLFPYCRSVTRIASEKQLTELRPTGTEGTWLSDDEFAAEGHSVRCIRRRRSDTHRAAPHMCVSRSKVSEGNTPDAAICSIAAAIRWFELACKQFLNGDLGPDISETLHTSEFIAT